jgi:hypothetical protein
MALEVTAKCVALVRPDACWSTALDSVSNGTIGSLRQTVVFGGHVAGIIQYILWKADDLAGRDEILFGSPAGYGVELPDNPLAGGVLDGMVWNVVINFLKAQVKDPAVMDKLAAWLAAFLK